MPGKEVELVLQTINTAGVVGVLVFFVYAFYKGHIVSKSMMENIIASTVRHVLAELRGVEPTFQSERGDPEGVGRGMLFPDKDGKYKP